MYEYKAKYIYIYVFMTKSDFHIAIVASKVVNMSSEAMQCI